MRVKDAVAVGILMDGDLVLTAESLVLGRSEGGRRRDLVEDLAEVLVPGKNLEPCRIGILDILNDPEPTPFVEVELQWLADQWFAQDCFDKEIPADLEPGLSLGGGCGVSLVIGPCVGILVSLEVF